MDEKDIVTWGKILGTVLGSGVSGGLIWRYLIPIIGSGSKKVQSENDVGSKTYETQIKQFERQEAEITKLETKIAKLEERLEKELQAKDDIRKEKEALQEQLHLLRLQMGKEAVLVAQTIELEQHKADLEKRLKKADVRISHLEKLLEDMAQAKEPANPKIISSD